MYENSDSDDEADPHSRVTLPSRFLRAKQQAENGEEDRYESDSEGASDGHLEDSDARVLDSESEIQSVIEQGIPEAGSVAMFNILSEMTDEFMRTVKQMREQTSSSKEGNVDSLRFPVHDSRKRSLKFSPFGVYLRTSPTSERKKTRLQNLERIPILKIWNFGILE